MNTLATDGICKHCHKDGSTNFMECWVCREKYHVIECTLDPMVQTSLLKNQWPNILNKWTCITFTCPTCKEDFKTKEEAVMSSRVRLLEENSLKSNKQLDEIKELLTTVLTNQAQSSDNIETQKAPGKPAEETPTLIVVEKAENEEQTDEENKALWSEVTKAAIKSKVGVKKSFTNQSGQTVLVCNNEKSKQALLPHVTKAFTNRKINTPKPRLPTISVPFIHGKYENQELLNVLCQQNEDLGASFDQDNAQVLFTTPMRDREGLHQAVIRVSENLRKKIKDSGNRLCVGINSCPVFDRFFIKRCNRCQSFHHFHKDNGGCKKSPVCALCAGSHDTRSCHVDETQYKCSNCSKANKGQCSHAANSLDCPSYIAEQDKLKKSINYYAKNP